MKPSEAPGQPPASGGAQAGGPPQTPQSQGNTLPSQATPAYPGTQTAAPPKTTPTKSTVKALPTVRDHTTDQLNQAGDEYLPREIDEFGEKKVMPNGQLLGNRQYRCRTFLVPNRGDKLFMLATECARVLGYRDSYLLFNKNRSLFKIIASQAEKDDLVQQEILPFSYRSRQIAIVTARSMFRQFGSRVIEGGRRVRDDYWETKARKQGFTEADPAGEKRPGAAKAREAAEAQSNLLMSGAHTEIVYNTTPGPYPGAPQPHLVQAGMMGAPPGNLTRMPGLTVGAELNDTRPRDFSGIIKGGPRQEITGPAYQDQTRPSPLGELHSQAHHAAEFNRSVNQQRDMRGDYLQGIWRRPHEQPSTSSLNPIGSSDSAAATTRPSSSPHTTAAGVSQQSVVSSQSPQMMMTAAPYSQSIHAQNPIGQSPTRGTVTHIVQRNVPTNSCQELQAAAWAKTPQVTTTNPTRQCGLKTKRRITLMAATPPRPRDSTLHSPRPRTCASQVPDRCSQTCLSQAWAACNMGRTRACIPQSRPHGSIWLKMRLADRKYLRGGPDSTLLRSSGGRLRNSHSRSSRVRLLLTDSKSSRGARVVGPKLRLCY